MAAGFLGFMTEGIATAVSFRHLEGGPRVRAIQKHGWLQVASTVCIVLGFTAIYGNKSIHGKSHFTSLHGKVGLVNTLLALAAPLGGAFSFRKLGLITKLPDHWQPTVKWLHRCVGLLTWVLALVTVQIPLPHKAVLQGVLCRLWQVAVSMIGVIMLGTLRREGSAGQQTLPTSIQMGSPGSKNL